jgi:hypothetical protein
MPTYRRRKPRESGSMIRANVVVMRHEGNGEYIEHVFTGYTLYNGCVWAAVKPSWSKYWTVVHADTGYTLRRSIRTADKAKVVVERMEKYWANCTWETVLEHMSTVQHDLFYTRDEYRIRKNDECLYWNTGLARWVEYDMATVWSKEQKETADTSTLPLLNIGSWEIS